jgi:hypothetical protein
VTRRGILHEDRRDDDGKSAIAKFVFCQALEYADQANSDNTIETIRAHPDFDLDHQELRHSDHRFCLSYQQMGPTHSLARWEAVAAIQRQTDFY